MPARLHGSQPSSNMHACNSAAPHAHPASTRVHVAYIAKKHRPHILMPMPPSFSSRGMCFSTACVLPATRSKQKRKKPLLSFRDGGGLVDQSLEFIKLLAGDFRKRKPFLLVASCRFSRKFGKWDCVGFERKFQGFA